MRGLRLAWTEFLAEVLSEIERYEDLSSATVHEAAGKVGALPHGIKPVSAGLFAAGPAFPVSSPPGDNLWLHHAIYAAQPGDILVVDTNDAGAAFGYWGEVMAVAARQRGIAGLVITGGVRDSQRMARIGFPVFSGAIAIQGTGKDPAGRGSLGTPIVIGDVTISAGDFLVADDDGVVVIAQGRADEVISLSRHRDREEQQIFERLRAGETSIAIYNLPELQGQAQ